MLEVLSHRFELAVCRLLSAKTNGDFFMSFIHV